MSVEQAFAAVHTMNLDQLNQLVEAIKLRRIFLSKDAMRSVYVGATVEFQHNGNTVRGTVTHTGRKNVTVQTGAARFTVPSLLLKAVTTP